VSDLDYDKARQFADRVKEYGKTVIVFNTLETALMWLGIDRREGLALMKSLEGQLDLPASRN
jgi:hypothetical protein